MGNGMIREIDLHDSLNTRINKIETTETNVVNVTSQLSNLENEISNATSIIPEVNFGMNNVIKNTGKVSVNPRFTMIGKTVINLLGKDGNCEDVSKFGNFQTTHILDSSNKVFGNNAIKITLTSTYGSMYKMFNSLNIDVTKYYCFSAYVKNGNATSINIVKDATGGGSVVTGDLITDSTKFTRTFVKLSPSTLNNGNGIAIKLVGTIGQYGYVDGIMLEEITATQYADANFVPNPYVDSYSCLQNPYIEVRHDNLVRNGNGEEGVAWWINPYPNLGTLAYANGKFALVTTSTSVHFEQVVKVKPNTDYYVNCNTSGLTVLSVVNKSRTAGLRASTSGTFNTGNNDEIVLWFENPTAGTGTIDSIMLVEGTTAPTQYLPCRLERVVIEGKFTSDDSFTYENGEVSGLRNSKHGTLFGKDCDWQFWSDLTGAKGITLTKASVNQITSETPEKVVKYDGSIITHQSVFDANSKDVSCLDPNGTLFLALKDTDTGFTETINPNADELKAFMNSWKAVWFQGSRYAGWRSVVDGSLPSGVTQQTLTVATATSTTITVPNGLAFTVGDYIGIIRNGVYLSGFECAVTALTSTTITLSLAYTTMIGDVIFKLDIGNGRIDGISFCKSNVAPGYEGYQLHYKLQNSEIITDVNVHIHGDIPKFDVGDNYLYLDSGIVLKEIVNTKGDGTNYHINLDETKLSTLATGTELKYKVETINNVYKNEIYDTAKWSVGSASLSYGNVRLYQPLSSGYLDTSATYTVDYKILATQAPQIGSIACSYSQDIVNAISDLNEKIESRQGHDFALDNVVDLSMYEKNKRGNNYVFTPWYHTANSIFVNYRYNFKVSKKVIPKITVSNMIIAEGQGTVGSVIVTDKFYTVLVEVNTDYVVVRLATSDPTTISNIKSYGMQVDMDIVADCTGRI